jgi:isocitrate dehydrogenase
LKALFTPIANDLSSNESQIVNELTAVQGKPVEIGGYYQPDDALASAALRPSTTFNDILANL